MIGAILAWVVESWQAARAQGPRLWREFRTRTRADPVISWKKEIWGQTTDGVPRSAHPISPGGSRPREKRT
jgi:hypothetical protein